MCGGERKSKPDRKGRGMKGARGEGVNFKREKEGGKKRIRRSGDLYHRF